MKTGGERSEAAERPWHALTTPEVARRLSTHEETGLRQTEALARLQSVIPAGGRAKKPAALFTFFRQFASLPVLLLCASAALSLLTGGITEAGAVLTVVVANAVIGLVTESRARRTIQSLKRLLPPTAPVIRDGLRRSIGSEDVVPGDLVVLERGWCVPADCRIVDAHALCIDESMLTGESWPASKTSATLPSDGIPIAERVNIAYQGTLVVGGKGRGIAVATGANSQLGIIGRLAESAQPPPTPMELELSHAGNRLLAMCGGICAAILFLGLLRGTRLMPLIRSALSLAIAAVPEGLPALATMTLAVGIRRMRRESILVRKLDAIETLGKVTTVILDKTGTMTENRMRVAEIHTCNASFGSTEDRECLESLHAEQAAALMISCLCNCATIGGDSASLEGTSTEGALIECGIRAGIDIASLRGAHPLSGMMPRAEGRNYMVTHHRVLGPERPLAADDVAQWTGELTAVKGNPEEVLALCGRRLDRGCHQALSEAQRNEIAEWNRRISGRGLRVLGIAYGLGRRECGAGDGQGLIWLGLIGMADPIRPGIPDVLRAFRKAGISPVIATGDQLATACSIARQTGLSGEAPLGFTDGASMNGISDDHLAGMCARTQVFARVSPAQKMRIVQALQKSGHVVAMIGDGVNDSPALRAADVGIAMGKSGADPAREVADIVLGEDRLGKLVEAISEGRSTYANIGKTVRFLLSTNMSEVIVMTAGALIGRWPLTPMQLLWINLVSDIFPGLALSLDPPAPDVLGEPPRSRHERILSREALGRMALESGIIAHSSAAGYLYGILRYGWGARARTIGFLSLVSAQVLHTLSCRSQKHDFTRLPPNTYVKAACAAGLLLQAAVSLIPCGRSLLSLSSVGVSDAGIIAAAAGWSLFCNEAVKWLNAPVENRTVGNTSSKSGDSHDSRGQDRKRHTRQDATSPPAAQGVGRRA
jgi:Ca2+-transporting ATPase